MPKKNRFSFANLLGKPKPSKAAADPDEAEEEEEMEDEEEEEASASAEEEDSDEAEDEDEAEEEEDNDQASVAARASARERARWAKVLGHKVAASRMALACHLLANTDNSPAVIIGSLKATPEAAAPSGFATAMAGRGNPNLGTGAEAGGGQPKDHNARLIDFAKSRKAARDKRRGAA